MSKDAVKIGDTGIQKEVKAAGGTVERGRVAWIYDSMKKAQKCEKMRGAETGDAGIQKMSRCRWHDGKILMVRVYDSMKNTRKCEKMRGRKLETQGYGRCRGAGGMTERY